MRNRFLRIAFVALMMTVVSLGLDSQTASASSITIDGNCGIAVARFSLDAGTWYVQINANGQPNFRLGPLTGPISRGFQVNFNPPLPNSTTIYAQILDSNQNPTNVGANFHCNNNRQILCTNQDAIDGRLNSVCADPVQTAALYCNPTYTGFHVVMLANSVENGFFDIFPQEIAKVPARPATNTLVKAANGVSLWRLTTGEFQFNTPNHDNYIFGPAVIGPVTVQQICTGGITWYRPGQPH